MHHLQLERLRFPQAPTVARSTRWYTARWHDECLIRVDILDAQPIHKQRQEYRLVDAATGEFERGYVDVDDMIVNQPWAADLPVHVQRGV
jgi:hypothetical protein